MSHLYQFFFKFHEINNMHVYMISQNRFCKRLFEYFGGKDNEKTVIYFKTENDMNIFTLPSLYKK